MKIGEMFEKPINRDIKGVIKVSQHDDENIYQELNEYVVTKELSKHFRDFFENYKKGIDTHTDEMGVWISGYFGSGKSHLLKILSYILENKEVNGRKAIDFFKDDKKIFDPVVIADMELAANTSTDVILFNIDSKSTGSHMNKDPILHVFMKVFNEKLGFSGDRPFLADLERDLYANNLFDKFKSKFKELNGNDWLEKRSHFYFIQDYVVQTLSQIDYMSEKAARNWVDKAEANYSLSIEKFAELVKDYCESKGNDHHVVFLVDEVGQYIGDDSQLILNLQTLTEDLGVMCGGKAWIVVTSQEDIDAVTDVKGMDFSKILDRFQTRLSLSSANVDEVIKKRILAKKEPVIQTLELLYEDTGAILKNVISFSHDTSEKKMYIDSKDFAEVYPFIPYQFNLLGEVLTAIRIHGASGKNLGEGERSMLGMFQEAAISYMEENTSILMPFNIFYKSLPRYIDHIHSSVIIKAKENQKLEDFDVELLKVLFMIKYVTGIKANPQNLTTLMVGHIDEEVANLRNRIDKSLKRLVDQTLVQKNGEIYSFLTHEEQDINRAIQQENVELGEIINKASSVIFEDIFEDSKYSYSPRYNFLFNKAVDDRYLGKHSADIGVRVITPYYDFRLSTDDHRSRISPVSEGEQINTILRGISEENNEVIIHLGEDSSFLDEITGLLKIEKYLIKKSADLSPSSESILNAKQDEANEKRGRIKLYLKEALKHAEIYVKGDKVNIQEKDPVERIKDSLSKLVNKTYNKLSYMKTTPDKDDIFNVLKDTSLQEFGKPVENHLAVYELDDYIEQETQSHAKPALKTVLNKFKQAPYGFVDLDIEWLVAALFAQKRIYLEKTSQLLSLKKEGAREISNLLTDRREHEKILIDRKELTDPKMIKDVKEVLKDLFGMANSPNDDDSLMNIFQKESQEKVREIDLLLKEYNVENRYPGKNSLIESRELLQDVNNINSLREFFKFVSYHKDDFLDNAEDLEPVIHFFDGSQKGIFKNACDLVDLFDKDKNFIEDSKLTTKAKEIKNITEMPSPYSQIQKLPVISDEFKTSHNDILMKKSNPIIEEISTSLTEILGLLNSPELKAEFEVEFTENFTELEEKLKRTQEISAIPGIQTENEILKDKCIDKVEAYQRTIPIPPDDKTPKIDIKTIKLKKISSETMITIKDEKDIDEFFESLKKKLKDELGENTIITLRI